MQLSSSFVVATVTKCEDERCRHHGNGLLRDKLPYRLVSEWLWAWFTELVGTKGMFITLRWAGLFGIPGNSISTMSYRCIHALHILMH